MGNILTKKRSRDYLEDDHEGSSSSKRRRTSMNGELRAEVQSIVAAIPNLCDSVEYINKIDRAFEIVVHEDPSLLALQPVISCLMQAGQLPPSKLEQFIVACKQQNMPEPARNELWNEVLYRLSHAIHESTENLMILIQQFPEILGETHLDNDEGFGPYLDGAPHVCSVADVVLVHIWGLCLLRPEYNEKALFNVFMDQHLRWANCLNWECWIESMVNNTNSPSPCELLTLAPRVAQIFVKNQSGTASAFCTEDSNIDILLAVVPKLNLLQYTPFKDSTYNDTGIFGSPETNLPDHTHRLARLYTCLQEVKPSSLVALTLHISLDSAAEQAGTADLGKALRSLPALQSLCLIPRNLDPDIYDSDTNGLDYQKMVALVGGIAEEVSSLHQLQNLDITLYESAYGQCAGVSVTDSLIKLFKMGLQSLKITGPSFEAAVSCELRDAIVSNMSLTTFKVLENRKPGTSSYWDRTRAFVETSKEYVDLAKHYTKLNKVGRSHLWQSDVTNVSTESIVKCVLKTASLWHPDIAVSVLHTMFCGNPVLLSQCCN